LGCTGTASVTVSVGSGLIIPVSASPSTVCVGSSSTITASGANNYHWNTGETTASITVSPSQQTTYTVTGDNGSCTGSGSVTVGVSDPPTVIATASPATICAGSSSTLTASGNANVYLWNTQQTGQTITVSPTTTTTYAVAGYNAFNCRGIGQVDVVVDATNCSGTAGARISSDDEQTQTTNSDGIAVYPNPSHGISYVSNVPKGVVLEVYNAVGQKVIASPVESGSESIEINLLQYTRGIYFVKITQSGKSVYQGRVLKID